MTKRKTYFFSALILTLGVITLLVTGSSLLLIALDQKKLFPSGSLITWVGMISLPLTVYWGVKALRKPTSPLNRVLSWVLKFIIILGILWFPIAYLLAGNFTFTFTEKETFQGGQAAMRWFWRLSYGIGIGSFLTILVYWVSRLFRKRKPLHP